MSNCLPVPAMGQCEAFTVQHTASCRCILSGGFIPTSFSCQEKLDDNIFSEGVTLTLKPCDLQFLGVFLSPVPAYTASMSTAVETHAASCCLYVGGGICFFFPFLSLFLCPEEKGRNVIFTLCFTCEVSRDLMSSKMKPVWF